MKVEVLESSVGDNYFYLITNAGRGALIDPVDAPLAIRAVRGSGVELAYVVNTHFHHDHISGDDEVLESFPNASLVAGAVDAPIIENQIDAKVDRLVLAGDQLELGDDLSLEVLDTPGHTPGHISLRGQRWLFSGDTIFVGGAGNCRFGGDPGVLFRTFRDVLRALPDDMTFAPGHDYSARNIEFALSLLPTDLGAEMLERARRSEGIFLTTLGEERRYNPFLRFDDPALQEAVSTAHPDEWARERARSESDDEATFRTVRELRNHW